MDFTLMKTLNEDYCTVCVKYKDLTRNFFPKAIHFHWDKECLLFLTLHFGEVLTLSHFFSLPQQQYLQDSKSVDNEFLRLFSGGGKSLLCWTLKELLFKGLISSDQEIELEAGGDEVSDNDMIRLIDYYNYLGFEPIDNSQTITNGYPMKSTVKKVLNNCNQSTSIIGQYLKHQSLNMI